MGLGVLFVLLYTSQFNGSKFRKIMRICWLKLKASAYTCIHLVISQLTGQRLSPNSQAPSGASPLQSYIQNKLVSLMDRHWSGRCRSGWTLAWKNSYCPTLLTGTVTLHGAIEPRDTSPGYSFCSGLHASCPQLFAASRGRKQRTVAVLFSQYLIEVLSLK